MHRIDTPSRQKDKFGAGKDGFTQGDPQTGTQATQVSANFLDSIQEELAAVIEDQDSGIVLDKSKNNQLILAIKKIIRSAGMIASETLRGVTQIATQVQTEAGSSDEVAVTPKKLKNGFTCLLAPTGYIALPSWLKNVTLQWGVGTSKAVGTLDTTFPISFTTRCAAVVGSAVNSTVYSDSFELATTPSQTFFQCAVVSSGAGGNAIQVSTEFRWIAIGY